VVQAGLGFDAYFDAQSREMIPRLSRLVGLAVYSKPFDPAFQFRKESSVPRC
jgi:hypothetical protein